MELTGQPILFRLADVDCCLDAGGSPYMTALRRLDPYRIAPGGRASLMLDLTGNACYAGIGCELYREDTGFYSHRWYRSADGGTVCRCVRRRDGAVQLGWGISPSWDRISLCETGMAGAEAFEYLGLLVPLCLIPHTILTLHGVLMEHKGRGIIISAPSGTGKTTHARLWRDTRRALIINGDRAACRLADGVWMGFGLPWSGTSGEQINREVPITAVVVLERGDVNTAHRVTGMEAFRRVWPHVLRPAWDPVMTDLALSLTDALLSSVPVIRLCCRPDAASVDVLDRALPL